MLATLEICETGAQTGAAAHVVHCSLSRGYDIAADYRTRGFHASIECCIHYLTLDEENDVRRLGGKARINPPIRPRAEVEALWRQVSAGNVTLFVKGALQRGVPLTWAARLMAENPARHFRLGTKGALEAGKGADITVLVDRPMVHDAARSGHNVVGWSPYNGTELPWTVARTWLRGRQVLDGKNVAEPATGQWVRP